MNQNSTLRTAGTTSLDARLAVYSMSGDYLFSWWPGSPHTEVLFNEGNNLALRLRLSLRPDAREQSEKLLGCLLCSKHVIVVDCLEAPMIYKIVELETAEYRGALDKYVTVQFYRQVDELTDVVSVNEDPVAAPNQEEAAGDEDRVDELSAALAAAELPLSEEQIARGFNKLMAAIQRSEGAEKSFKLAEFNLYASSGQLILMRRHAVAGCEVAMEDSGRLVLNIERRPNTAINQKYHLPNLLEKGRLVVVQAQWARPLLDESEASRNDLNNEREPGPVRLYQVTQLLETLDPNLFQVELSVIADEAYEVEA